MLCYKLILFISIVALQSGSKAEFPGHKVATICRESEFQCHNGDCISTLFRCDSKKQCSDGEDELFCESSKDVSECTKNEFKCMDSGYCLPITWKCNGEAECHDGSDELGCDIIVNGTCTSHDGVEEFHCSSGECIPMEYVCDHSKDCKDGSDEIKCDNKFIIPRVSPVYINVSCNVDEGYFRCDNDSKCLDVNRVCNNRTDCTDGSDEGTRCWDANEHCICDVQCIKTPKGLYCPCTRGYKHNGLKCTDIDECTEQLDTCSQVCQNNVGSYKCYCNEDFILGDDQKSCFAKSGDAILVYTLRDQIKSFNISSKTINTITDSTKQAIGVAYDGIFVYWTEIHKGHEKITRSDINGGHKEVLIDSGLETPEDVAVDWFTGNIYFTDNRLSRIAACTSDGEHCSVLITKGIELPRAIVLHPHMGIMFWSDWGHKPAIMRANMDGSDVTDFITNDLMWPNGLTIDYPSDRLYWVDGHYGRIESVKLDGTGRHPVLQNHLHHPYWVAIYENKLYWSDWATKSLMSCDKLTGKNRQTLDQALVYGMDLYHPLLKKSKPSHACQHNHCSHMCLLRGENKYTCACAQDKVLNKNGLTCNDVARPTFLLAGSGNLLVKIKYQQLGKHVVTPLLYLNVGTIDGLTYNSLNGLLYIYDDTRKLILSLDITEFTSDKSNVIAYGDIGRIEDLAYDYIANVLYWVDSELKTLEVLSLNTGHRTILFTFTDIPVSLALLSNYGKIYVALQRGTNNVHIDSLSMNGAKRVHVFDNGFRGPTIRIRYSDELDTLFITDSGNGYISTSHAEGSGRHSFRKTGSDVVSMAVLGQEVFWTNRFSKYINYANIMDTESVPARWTKLDVFIDNIEHLHLESITPTRSKLQGVMNHPCAINKTICTHICVQTEHSTNDMTLPSTFLEEYACLCPGGMILNQELNICEDRVTCFDRFYCYKSNVCVDFSRQCNGIRDCHFGEDEEYCVGDSGNKCGPDSFQCGNGDCIVRSKQCDHKVDCKDGKDESNCGEHRIDSTCNPHQFKCNSSNHCIENRSLCNGKYDCTDGTDEDVHMCSELKCTKEQFKCTTTGNCIPNSWVCDGEIDCFGGSDEHVHCNVSNVCGPLQFTCNTGQCIDFKMRCNGIDDCGDSSDEELCHPHYDEDFLYECGHDEFNCPTNYTICLLYSAKCNGTVECPDGADEENCPAPITECEDTEYKCKRDGRCVPNMWKCDGKIDCIDGEDESKEACLERHLHFHTNFKMSIKCEHGFQCSTGECIDYNEVCNGIDNCLDGSDENGLCASACKGHKCQERCQSTPKGSFCQCQTGFKISNDSVTCQDINECVEIVDACSQICRNNVGSYYCDCHPGYTLRTDGVTCKAVGGVASIMYLNKNEIRSILPNGEGHQLLHIEYNVTLLNSLAVNYRQNTIYYTTESQGALYSLNKGTGAKIIITNIGRPTKVGVEFVTNNVYYLNNDESNRSINVCDMNRRKCARILTVRSHVELTALTIDPMNKRLFFCSTEAVGISSLYSATLSGNALHKLSELKLCSGLALDFNKRMVYVADNRVVYAFNYDGTERIKVSHERYSLRPTSIAVFEDTLYHLNSVTSKLTKCLLFGERTCRYINVHVYNSRGFDIYHETMQSGSIENPCMNLTCENVCVLGMSGAICVCPDGDILPPGKTSCDHLHMNITSWPVFHSDGIVIEPVNESISGALMFMIVMLLLIVLCAGITVLYHYTSKLKPSCGAVRENHAVHFQNPIYDNELSSEPVVTIPSQTNINNGSPHNYGVQLNKYLQSKWTHIARKIKPIKTQNNTMPAGHNVDREMDSDSDVESDRDFFDFREKASLI